MPPEPPKPPEETGLIIRPGSGLALLQNGDSTVLSEIINRSLAHIQTSNALAVTERKPGEEWEFEIAHGVEMVMCWIPKDYAEAVKWYRKAAEKGVTAAQFKLGICYCNGEGIPKDYAEAVKWFRKAADQGDALAQIILGANYSDDEGVPRDNVKAYMWASLAMGRYGRACDRLVSLRKLLTPEEIAKAEQMADEWWKGKNKNHLK